MKSIWLLGTLILICVQVNARALMRSDITDEEEICLSELNLEASTILQYFSTDDFPEDNMDFNNFFGCYSKQMGILNPTGEINYDVVKRLFLHAAKDDNQPDHVFYSLYKHILNQAIDECQRSSIMGITYGEVVTKTFNCIFRKMRQAVEI